MRYFSRSRLILPAGEKKYVESRKDKCATTRFLFKRWNLPGPWCFERHYPIWLQDASALGGEVEV